MSVVTSGGETETFYNDLADVYHLIYEDWPRSIENQANVLDALIREHDQHAKVVADVACGIGTQSLGLAARGYAVTASDVSVSAIERAKREAASRNLRIDTRIDDMLLLSTYPDASADALIACDNAIPHLSTDELIQQAFATFFRVLRPGGLCILSVRDYAALPAVAVRFVPYGVRQIDGGKVAMFQIWDYEGAHYRLAMYFVFDRERKIETKVFRATYYSVSIDRLMKLMSAVGFRDVLRIDGKFFQPLITAVRPRDGE